MGIGKEAAYAELTSEQQLLEVKENNEGEKSPSLLTLSPGGRKIALKGRPIIREERRI